jgi:hypothetical protein
VRTTAVPLRDRADDRESQSAAGGGVSGAQADEPVEDRLLLVCGDAGAVVPHGDDEAARRFLRAVGFEAAARDLDPQADAGSGLREPHRIGGQLDDRLDESGVVGQHEAGRVRIEDPLAVAQVLDAGQHAGSEALEVYGRHAEEVGPAGLRQRGQVAHQLVHPLDLLERDLVALLHVRGIRAVRGLQGAPDDGERGAQLVAHVAHEPALLCESVADPVEHRVEGAGQGGHVVVAVRDRHPPVQVVGRDRPGRVPQLLERAHEAAADQLPRDRGQEEDAQ